MSFTDLLPVRIGLLDRRPRVVRKHRAIDEVDRQKQLRAGADLLINGLRLQLAEQEAEHAAVVARIDKRYAEAIRGLEQQVTDLERRLQIGVLASAAADQTQPIPVITPVPLHQSPMARRNPGHVPGWVKDQPEPAA